MRTFATAAMLTFFLAACGSAQSGEFAGHWREQGTTPGSGYELMLTGTGTTIGGTGVRHREAGTDAPFTVSGSTALVPGYGVTFDYGGGVSEGFGFNQIDASHLGLQDANGATRVFLKVQL